MSSEIRFDHLPLGAVVEVVTQNTKYIIVKYDGGSAINALISGHHYYCPTVVEAELVGCWGLRDSDQSSVDNLCVLRVGQHMMFSINGNVIRSSKIASVRVITGDAPHDNSQFIGSETVAAA